MRFSFGSARQWHWISAAICMIGMFMFAITGITLNHAADIEVAPQVRNVEAELPDNVLSDISELPEGSVAASTR